MTPGVEAIGKRDYWSDVNDPAVLRQPPPIRPVRLFQPSSNGHPECKVRRDSLTWTSCSRHPALQAQVMLPPQARSADC